MTQELFQIFSQHEDDLIKRFHKHQFFVDFCTMSDARLKEFLRQKWFVSEAFVPLYDKAVNALNDDGARQILKRIIADESAVGFPSHREDLLTDLEFIGVSREEVLTTKLTKRTANYLARSTELVRYTNHSDHDLRVMVALRIACEVLAAEEYRHVVPELEKRFELTPDRSKFYAPHFYHDRKDSKTGQHTHSFESVLERMLINEQKLEIAIESADKAFAIRNGLYDQFVGWGTSKSNVKYGAAVLAGVEVLAAALLLNPGEKPNLYSLDPATKAFYERIQKDADQVHFAKYFRTHDRKELEKIGIEKGMIEIFGDWP